MIARNKNCAKDASNPEVPTNLDCLNPPYGGTLVNLLVDAEHCAGLQAASCYWLSWDLTSRQLCDLELLLNGAFSPLRGFMTRDCYDRVCSSMRLPDGTLWPIPVTLDIPEALARQLKPGTTLALRDAEGFMLAGLHVEDVWEPDRKAEAQALFGTINPEHPGVDYLLSSSHPWYAGGRLEGLSLPLHYDFLTLRKTPAELRDEFTRSGWRRIAAFHIRNPMHRADWESALCVSRKAGANLLIHPAVGPTKPGDVDHYTRIRCYQALVPHHPEGRAKLALLPLAMRMGGPREALWHAIIRKNYGCTHLIVGPDHAGPGMDSSGRPFYGLCEAQQVLRTHQAELGIEMLPSETMVYVKEIERYLPKDELSQEKPAADVSRADLERLVMEGADVPEWLTFPEVAHEIRRSDPPRERLGFTIFLTGLSGAGKSTIANVLLVKLLERGGRQVTLLDGDLVRKHLSSELGFSKDHRDLNIRRIGYVASEITKHGGAAICAPIAPYDAVRKEVRAMVVPHGGFFLVYVSTPLDICEGRDRKGLYAKARAGILQQFTGISDPYEVPQDAEIVIDTTAVTPLEAAQRILHHLDRESYFRSQAEDSP